ncbi:probable protein phosphatase 2C 49 [Asparagus officinalis]|uniref:probable protein phosphatase 2C 49 n=1 Tax=Asparagus officinalis TaxID=4686 RepID=UPI00098E11AC|nr:probable protein phosphatase 2C 49 [Asparagus officinalis]
MREARRRLIKCGRASSAAVEPGRELEVSTLAKEKMCRLMTEELVRMESPERMDTRATKSAVKRCYARMDRMDELALWTCECGRYLGRIKCSCDRSRPTSHLLGSTAVTAVVGPHRLMVANCGDSRAVLSRAGVAIPMSFDHKPDRPNEMARIRSAGGWVLYLNGARVCGILAMSRALGDMSLKPVVISEPEIRIMDRNPKDECLVIASDGLWDVMSNATACNLARRVLQDGDPDGDEEHNKDKGKGSSDSAKEKKKEYPSQSQCDLAAALLARLALARNSEDNISVIVVDLRKEMA